MGEKMSKRLIVVVVVSHIQRIGCQPEKLLNTVVNPARGLSKERKTKRESLAAPLPHAARSEKMK